MSRRGGSDSLPSLHQGGSCATARTGPIQEELLDLNVKRRRTLSHRLPIAEPHKFTSPKGGISGRYPVVVSPRLKSGLPGAAFTEFKENADLPNNVLATGARPIRHRPPHETTRLFVDCDVRPASVPVPSESHNQTQMRHRTGPTAILDDPRGDAADGGNCDAKYSKGSDGGISGDGGEGSGSGDGGEGSGSGAEAMGRFSSDDGGTDSEEVNEDPFETHFCDYRPNPVYYGFDNLDFVDVDVEETEPSLTERFNRRFNIDALRSITSFVSDVLFEAAHLSRKWHSTLTFDFHYWKTGRVQCVEELGDLLQIFERYLIWGSPGSATFLRHLDSTELSSFIEALDFLFALKCTDEELSKVKKCFHIVRKVEEGARFPFSRKTASLSDVQHQTKHEPLLPSDYMTLSPPQLDLTDSPPQFDLTHSTPQLDLTHQATTSGVPTTTSGVPTTTSGVPTTTSGVPRTSSGVPTTTASISRSDFPTSPTPTKPSHFLAAQPSIPLASRPSLCVPPSAPSPHLSSATRTIPLQLSHNIFAAEKLARDSNFVRPIGNGKVLHHSYSALPERLLSSAVCHRMHNCAAIPAQLHTRTSSPMLQADPTTTVTTMPRQVYDFSFTPLSLTFKPEHSSSAPVLKSNAGCPTSSPHSSPQPPSPPVLRQLAYRRQMMGHHLAGYLHRQPSAATALAALNLTYAQARPQTP